MRLIYLWTTRIILAIAVVGILPVQNNTSILVAQSKKQKATQASKYAKRGNSKAKQKDYKGALSDYKKAYQLNPSANYKKEFNNSHPWQKKAVAHHLLKRNHPKNKWPRLQPIPNEVIPKRNKKNMLVH